MAPHVVLLFNTKHDRDKDRADLRACLPLMSAGETEWLAAAIKTVHPGHSWLPIVG